MGAKEPRYFQIIGGAVPVKKLFRYETDQLNFPQGEGAGTVAAQQVQATAQPQFMAGSGRAARNGSDFNSTSVLVNSNNVWFQLAAANAKRNYLLIQNQNLNDAIQVYFGAKPNTIFTAQGGSVGAVIGPGQSYEFFYWIPKNVVWVANVFNATHQSPVSVVQG